MNERADVMAQLAADPVDRMVAVASEGFCPRCGDPLKTGSMGTGVVWCWPTCRIGWQLVVTLWPDARHVELEEYSPITGRRGSHGWVDR